MLNPRVSNLLTFTAIPACAGEPRSGESGIPGLWVYPRVCGGTKDNSTERERDSGLSPRVRGNPMCARLTPFNDGSIPACAGEPASLANPVYVLWVYPRVCGGTIGFQEFHVSLVGLSPRVRGNHSIRRRRRLRIGSIPACAGWNHSIRRRRRLRIGSIPACAGEPFYTA